MKVKEWSLRTGLGEKMDQKERRDWKDVLKEEILWKRDTLEIWIPSEVRTLAMVKATGEHTS